jgi:hypothetical protein
MDEAVKRENRPVAWTVVTITVVATSALFVICWKFTDYPLGELLNTWVIGFPIGLVIGFTWYLLLFSLILPRLPGIASSIIETIRINKEFSFIFLVILFSLLISLAYSKLTWSISIGETVTIAPRLGALFQILSILAPILASWVINYSLSYSYLKLERKQSHILAFLLSFFGFSWLVLLWPYLAG